MYKRQVKKISSHITKKVADKLNEMFKGDRKAFEEKWEDMKVIVEYGMLTEKKFFDKAEKFALYQNVDGTYSTWTEYLDKIKVNQVDKDGKTIKGTDKDLGGTMRLGAYEAKLEENSMIRKIYGKKSFS